jgi:hypothetical protein
MPTAIATSVKTGKFSLAVGGETRRSKKSWREQLAAYFGKVDLDIDIKAARTR